MSQPATLSREAIRRPNVLWIFGDQHRASALGCSGDPNLHTPNIDQLAADGLRSTGGIGGTPLCCPYRGALLSGRYPHNSVPGHEYPLDPSLPTVAEPFNQAGYHTAYFGKWHVDGFHEGGGRAVFHTISPERRGGFKQWLGYENNNAQYDCWLHGHDEHGKEIPHLRIPDFETDGLTDLMLDYLNQQAERQNEQDGDPFFAVLSVQPPHNPYVAPAEWMQRHNPAGVELRPNVPRGSWIEERARRELAGYYAMIENLDWNIGRLVQALRDTGLYDDTHIIFFSDHGDMHGSNGQFLKTSMYEDSLRVPMIFGGGRRYRDHGGVTDALINHVDLGPTSLGLCGIDKPEWMQGTDCSGIRVKDRSRDLPDSAYCQLPIPTGHGNSVGLPWRGVVTRDGWKYATFEGAPWLMFNLNDDPYELANRAHDPGYKAKRKELHDRAVQWAKETGDDQFAFPQP